MSVLLELSIGDIVIDLKTENAPKSCLNFIKLCKFKYYNFAPIYNVQKDFSFQSGDPLYPVGNGGSSIWGLLGTGPTFYPAERKQKSLKHQKKGTVSMIGARVKDSDSILIGSQFIITLADNTPTLDNRGVIIGQVVEGFDVLAKINSVLCDDQNRPFQDIRIRHSIIIEDTYENPRGFVSPSSSPLPSEQQLATIREFDSSEDEETKEEMRRQRDARAQALTLEMVGDLPFAEVAPPENVLFVCKLNPVTIEEDLELIFSRFGKVLNCEVIRDKVTGDSLQYAFIEFKDKSACEMAYFKMQDVLIDDRRIHVDFSQGIIRNYNDRYNPDMIKFEKRDRYSAVYDEDDLYIKAEKYRGLQRNEKDSQRHEEDLQSYDETSKRHKSVTQKWGKDFEGNHYRDSRNLRDSYYRDSKDKSSRYRHFRDRDSHYREYRDRDLDYRGSRDKYLHYRDSRDYRESRDRDQDARKIYQKLRD